MIHHDFCSSFCFYSIILLFLLTERKPHSEVWVEITNTHVKTAFPLKMNQQHTRQLLSGPATSSSEGQELRDLSEPAMAVRQEDVREDGEAKHVSCDDGLTFKIHFVIYNLTYFFCCNIIIGFSTLSIWIFKLNQFSKFV